MFQKFFGGMFGSSGHGGHQGSSHQAKKDAHTEVSVDSATGTSTSPHSHKHHKHLRAQRGLKPYHNSQNPDRQPPDVDMTSDVISVTSRTSGRDAGDTHSPGTVVGRGMSSRPSATTIDSVAGASMSSTSAIPSLRPVKTDAYYRSEPPFLAAMEGDSVDLSALRTLSWHGCPVALRGDVWMLLTGHWHPVASLRPSVVARKRQEYTSYVQGNYNLVDWDAVCALADRGKDGASVRRSTLLSHRHGANALPSRHPSHARTPQRQNPSSDCADRSDDGAESESAPATTRLLRPRPSHSTLDLMALEDTPTRHEPSDPPSTHITRAPSVSAGQPLDGTLGPVSSAPFSQDADRDMGEMEEYTLVKDASVTSAPAALSVEDVARPYDADLDSVPSLRTEADVRPVTPPFLSEPGTATADGHQVGLQAADASPSRPPRAQTASLPSAAAGSPLPRRRQTATPRVSVSTMVTSKEIQILKQIRKDVPRMSGGMAYLQHPRVQGMVERILFTWSLRHPACGYVQGMNDLLLPFVSVNLARRFCPTRSITELRAFSADTVEGLWSEAAVPAHVWVGELEADIYWCAAYFLNGMQDNYTQNQTGIYHMCERLRQVISAADSRLYAHLVDTLQLNFVQFTFRWMNCMLMRELTAVQQLRLMDAYLSDQERRWNVTHVYVCAALLLRWSKQLLQMDQFIEAASFLQSPPTASMTPREMDDVLSEAFVLENLYDAGLQHLQTSHRAGAP